MKTKDYNVRFREDTGVASMTDCTGLMPAPPQSEAEYRSYAELAGSIPK
ncbi:MAG: hypothetical protein FWF10_04160 [Clostridiales bacterium]|nr:hypothetical protein [Clostridiales bacterium]